MRPSSDKADRRNVNYLTSCFLQSLAAPETLQNWHIVNYFSTCQFLYTIVAYLVKEKPLGAIIS